MTSAGITPNDITNDRNKADQDVIGLIRNFKKKLHLRNPANAKKVMISRADVEYILRIIKSEAKSDKFDHNAFALFRFTFALFQFYKWRQSNELDLPYTILRRLTSKKRMNQQLGALCRLQLLSLEREANQLLHECRRYKLHYTISDQGDYSEPEEALSSIYGKSELFSICTRGIYERLHQYGARKLQKGGVK